MTCKWTLPGFLINFMTTLIPYEMSRWVKIVTYIILPTTEAYGTPEICSFSFVNKKIVDYKIVFQLMTHSERMKT